MFFLLGSFFSERASGTTDRRRMRRGERIERSVTSDDNDDTIQRQEDGERREREALTLDKETGPDEVDVAGAVTVVA